MKQLHNTDLLTMFVITLFGVFQGQVTVFYIIYLFWFQELVRTLVDFVCIFRQKKRITDKFNFIKISFGSFFLLYVYAMFILLLFGFMLNWDNNELLGQNMRVLIFHNWYFNINMILFLAQYIYFRSKTDNTDLRLPLFSGRHIILHVSIILGALIQLAIVPHFNLENMWASGLVILPFLLLKIFLDRRENIEISGNE